jgi:F-type H+-transporting ATPase subunit b
MITMILALTAQAQAGGGQVEQIARTFGVDWPHLTAQIISFGIICALLYWLAYQPVLRMLDERRRLIALGLDAQRRDVLAEARAQSTQLIAEAGDIAKRLAEREASRAAAAAAQVMRAAQEQAAREHVRMLAELRGDIGRLVVQTTSAVIGKVLTPEDQHRLMEESARELKASHMGPVQ